MKSARLLILGVLIYTVAAVIVSIFIIKPPKPIIEIKGETLVTISDTGNAMTSVIITNTLFTAWVVMGILLVFVFVAMRGKAMIPSGLYNFFESIIELIYGFVCSIAGERNGRRFFPVIATFFIYIAFANWLSLTPVFNTIGIYEPIHAEEEHFHDEAIVFTGSDSLSLIGFGAAVEEIDAVDCAEGSEGEHCRELALEEVEHNLAEGEKIGLLAPYFRSINTDLMTPLSFAIISAFFVEWWGISTLGFRRYTSKFLNFRGPIDFFVGILEFFAEVARLISFSFRLFGNMLAGEILLLVMTFLVAVASPILVIFYGLELFVGAVQAFVFGTLTLVFAVLAVTAHEGGDHEHEGSEAHH